MNREERIRGGLYGLLVGDALGVPYEFHDPANLPAQHAIEMSPPASFNRSHPRQRSGAPSVTGSEALALFDSLLIVGRMDAEDFGGRLGALEATSTAHADGSIVRALPLAVWHQGSDEALVRDAHTQAAITKAHPQTQVCAALYALWARGVLDEFPDPWDAAVRSLKRIYQGDAAQQLLLRHALANTESCLGNARLAVNELDFESVVRKAVSFGLAASTTAALAGGIAGLMFGEATIPPRWIVVLPGTVYADALLDRLIAPIDLSDDEFGDIPQHTDVHGSVTVEAFGGAVGGAFGEGEQ